MQFSVKKAIEKVQDWMSAAERLRSRVSDDDEVFAAWCTLLRDFYQHLPPLLKLSHKALTVKSLPHISSSSRRMANSLNSLSS